MARLKVLRPMTLSTLAGALIGSAGLLLDWDKAWQVCIVLFGACEMYLTQAAAVH